MGGGAIWWSALFPCHPESSCSTTGVKGGAEVQPLKLFILSNNYLAAVFVGLSVDAVLGLPVLGTML